MSRQELGRAVVGAQDAGARLDRFLSLELMPSKASARKAAKRGDVLLNGQPVESSRIVQAGDQVVLLASSKGAHKVLELRVPVLYEDDWMAVVDKPAGLATSGSKYRTLEHALPFNLGPSPLPHALAAPRVVHRLDFGTSGLVAVAKTGDAHGAMGRAFEARQVDKTYLAVAVGALAGQGVCEAPIEGRSARTVWRTLEVWSSPRFGHLSLVEAKPETGRTHQIRRHLALLGHPIVGDEVYGDDVGIGRGLLLCAVALALPHPHTGETLTVRRDPPPKFLRLRRPEAP